MKRFHERFQEISSPLSINEYADPKRYDELYMGDRIHDELADLSNDQGGISWGWSYRMMSLNEMYRATGDIKYLAANLSIIKTILSVRDDRIGKSLWTGETAPAWGSDKYAERGRAIFAVHTGMILYPMYECLQLAKEQPEISASFKEEFQTILADCNETLSWHDKQFRWGPGEGEACYIGMDQENAMEDKPLPGNRLSAMGRALYHAGIVNRNEEFSRRALAIGRYIKNRLSTGEDGAYYWPYWLPLQPPQTVIQKEKISGEDVSHASLTMALLVELAREKDFMTGRDFEKLGKTVRQGFGRLDNGVLFGSINGNPRSNPSLVQIPARWLRLSPNADGVYECISQFYLRYVQNPGPLDLALLIRYSHPALSASNPPDIPSIQQRLFEKVFGDYVKLDPELHQQVAGSEPGKRFYVDADNDGRPDEVWFIDEDSRHPRKYRPLLVRAIDEDGDLERDGAPDRDSDLYIADWKADGSVDAVLDYTDADGDGDLDEMGMYFFGGSANYFQEPVLRVWWSKDVGDDNLLWYDVGYTYDQRLCQNKTHFGGDELFVSFALPLNGDRWIPFFENPFLFYDRDGDGVAEEVLRLSGVGMDVESIRYSFNADNDATLQAPRDFDVSISAWAQGAAPKPAPNQRGRSNLQLDESMTESIELRGIPSALFLAYQSAPDFVKPVRWERLLLTWDEIDLNVDAQSNYEESHERWEGVIAHGADDFPQIGGPSCGPFNKRYELISSAPHPIQIYYHPSDRRIHLKNAERAWMLVDIDFDRIADMRYELTDQNQNGYIDRCELDIDADGTIDDAWDLDDENVEELEWSWSAVHAKVDEILMDALADLIHCNQTLRRVFQKIDPGLWEKIFTRFPAWEQVENLDAAKAFQLSASKESLRYRIELLNHSLLFELKKRVPGDDLWIPLNRSRARGDIEKIIQFLEQFYELESTR
ncbi:MAG: hypothetical protein JXR73_11085 [Candidatus Omnitrophica bacterium]|nr:hypothetical protein [Candidatus Omnitrophota bacterium]